MTARRNYALVTAARNEERYIEKTIAAVVSQTLLPVKWSIVDDGSSDRTLEVIERYAGRHALIQPVSLTARDTRDFGAQVKATGAGYQALEDVEFDYLGILDADISFEHDYYERILSKFEELPRLGVGGGAIYEYTGGGWHPISHRADHIGGAIHFFRRECYDGIGGYKPLTCGGQDVVAEVEARMLGWEVRMFPELKVYHNRRVGTVGSTLLAFCLRSGMLEYSIGSHPVFVVLKSLRRTLQRPILLGSILRLWAYSLCYLRRDERPVDRRFIGFLRHEQLQRLRTSLPGLRRAVNTSRQERSIDG